MIKITGKERKGVIKEVREWKHPGEDNFTVTKIGNNYENWKKGSVKYHRETREDEKWRKRP